MINGNKHSKNSFIVFVVVFSLLFFICKLCLINASASIGTIDSVYKDAMGVDTVGLKVDFGLFKGSIGVTVTDTGITGFAWGEKTGWINLSPSGGGVLNNGNGVLSGYATTESGGWINFSGVKINSSGDFTGYASSQNFGRISFNCSNDNSCAVNNFKVTTDWRPISFRGGSNNSSSNVVVPATPPPSAPTTTTTTTTEESSTPSETQEQAPTPAPLPVASNSQYYQGGGDVVKTYTANGELGQVTIIKPQDHPEKNTPTSAPVQPVATNPTDTTNIDKNTGVENVSNAIANNIVQTTKAIKKEAVLLSQTPGVDVSTKTVSTVGVAGGGTALVTSLATSSLSFSEFILNFFRLWSVLLSALGLRKRREPWGVVYDSITKQPLDPAYVILQNKQGEEVATSITDLEGRYGFLAPPGIYRIIAKKTNYIAPSFHLYGRERDELYDNLYFGEEIEIGTSKAIAKNIPMDQQGFDWNEFAKRDKNIIKSHSPHKKLLTQISNILFYAGLLFAIGLFIAKIDAYNTAILVLYAFLSVLRFVNIKPKSFGVITEHNTGFPLSFAIVRVFSKESNREMFHRVADQYGHYYCLLQKGEYYITIEKKNNDESYSVVYTSEPFISKKKILNRDFRV